MLELFQITGSCSFAARAALEEAGVEYATVDVHPRRRHEAPGFEEVNPLRRVPALRDGGECVYMLKGWESYMDGYVLGGEALAAHYARVGARPAIVRTRELDDLDVRLLRYHPELRAGKPIG